MRRDHTHRHRDETSTSSRIRPVNREARTAMLRLRLLGSHIVESRNRPTAPALIHKPKRFALLAYLAAALPRGGHTRAQLVALFWPEFDQQRARAALNRTLYALRQELGDGVVVSHGNDMVGLEPDALWCDVVAFEAAIEAGDPGGALELYRGDLLPGFFVPGAPEFERWLERERSRLRERAVRAALELADTMPDVTHWLRRAREINPDDERILRRLLAKLDASGDRAAALREYDAFTRSLDDDYDAEPSPETRDLVHAIRTRAVAEADGQPRGAAAVAVSADTATMAVSADTATAGNQQAEMPAVDLDRSRLGRTGLGRRGVRWRLWSGVAALLCLGIAVALALRTLGGGGAAAASDADPVTRSIPAFEAFAQGEGALRAGRFAEAQLHFQRAVRADTAFALAYLRLSQAANWTGADWLARSAADDAIRLQAGLSGRHRRFAVAWRAYIAGAAEEAERGFRSLVADDSLDADAWLQLGETLFHWGPTFGWSAEEAGAAFARVLELEPDNTAAIIHEARLVAGARELARLDTLADRLLRLEPAGDRALESRVLRAWVARDTAEQNRLLNELRTVDHATLWQIATSLAAHASDPGATLRLVPLLRPAPDLTSGDPKGHVEVRLFAAILEAARGRFKVANAWLDSVAVINPAKALEYRAALAVLPVAPLGREARAAILRELERYRSPEPMLPTAPLNAPQRAMFIGILAALAGDPAAVERALDGLAESAGEGLGTQLRVFRMRAEMLIRAEAARATHDPNAALDEIVRFPLAADSTLPSYDIDHADAQMRWLRAELLDALGHDEEALRWYATFPDPAANDLMYIAPANLHRARIHERRGERTEAARHYARAAALWRDADPEPRPLVEEARRGAERSQAGFR
jgi:DNA-binding SARP family transcriptional activator